MYSFATKEHYEKLYGSTPNEKDRPSMKFPKELKEEGDLHKDMMVSAKVRGVIKCLMCRKPRCFYSNAKLTGAVKENVEYLVEEEEYVCGGCFVDDDSWLRHSVVVRRQLTYDSQILLFGENWIQTNLYSLRRDIGCYSCR